MKFSLLSFAAVLPMAAAHFTIQYPTSRGLNEEKMPEFPCGGMPPSSTRTKLPLDGSFPVAVKLGHSQTALEVLLALGTDPGTNYNITLVPTFHISGLGAFCLPHVDISEQAIGVNITDGMNATIQVQSNGDPTGGLYACADVQFSADVSYSEPSSCKNNTNVQASAFPSAAAHRNANESTAQGQPQDGHGHDHGHGSGAGSASSTGAAVPLQTAAWGVLGAAFAGGMAIL